MATLTIKYPFLTKDGKEYTSTDTLLDDLAKETYGSYLLGDNSCWHGGIHISTEAFKHHKDKQMVRCLMDGEVIAYRLNKTYPITPWQAAKNKPQEQLKYSNGFCLIKHNYESPANIEEGANKGKTNKLTFYSLYMHLADYQTYQSRETDVPAGSQHYILKRNRNVRHTDDLQKVIGVLGEGSVVEYADNEPVRKESIDPSEKKYNFVKAKIIKISGKTDSCVTAGSIVYINCGSANLILQSEQKKKKEIPGYWKGKVTAKIDKQRMFVYDSEQACIDHLTDRTKIPLLQCDGQVITFESGKVKEVASKGKLHRIAPCQLSSSPTFATNLSADSKVWMYVDQDQISYVSSEPTQFECIVNCDIPIPILAGDPIGYLGAWESPAVKLESGEVDRIYQMHIELFAADDKAALETFIKNKAVLKLGKQYLRIEQGAPIYLNVGGKYELAANHMSVAKSGALELTIVPSTAYTIEADTNKEEYYKLNELVSGDINSGKITINNAYVKSTDNKVKKISQYDLNLLGYELVEESNNNTDGFFDLENIKSSLFQQVFKKIDSTNDKKISDDEMKSVLKNNELRTRLNRIIAGHPSEWHAVTQSSIAALFDKEKAKATLDVDKALMDFEKNRLQTCEFLSQIKGITQKLWHFHPVELIQQLKLQSVAMGKLQKLIEFEEYHVGLIYPKVSGGITANALKQYRNSNESCFAPKEKGASQHHCLAYVKVALYQSGYISKVTGTEKAKNSGADWLAESFQDVTSEFLQVEVNGIVMPDIVWALPGDVIVYKKISDPDSDGHIDIRTYHGYGSDFIWPGRGGFPDCNIYQPIGIYRKDSDLKAGKRLQAFLRILREYETDGYEKQGLNPYKAIYSGGRQKKTFDDFSQHPFTEEKAANTPAGAYQIVAKTYNKNIVPSMHWPTRFDPEMQDRAAVFLMQGRAVKPMGDVRRTALGYLYEDNIQGMIEDCKLYNEWSCLPNGKDQKLTLIELTNKLNQYLEE